MLGKLRGEFPPAARVFVLKLDAGRAERVGFGCLRHGLLLELVCRRRRFGRKLHALVGCRAVPAARHDQ